MLLHILYADIEDEFTMYTVRGLIHKVVLGTLAPYQMSQFFVEFNITHSTIWSNLSFDQSEQLFKNMYNSYAQLSKVTKKTNVPSSSIMDVPHPNVFSLTTKPIELKGKNVIHQ